MGTGVVVASLASTAGGHRPEFINTAHPLTSTIQEHRLELQVGLAQNSSTLLNGRIIELQVGLAQNSSAQLKGGLAEPP